MAGGLNHMLAGLIAIACVAFTSTAAAQTLRDPTRPPATSMKGSAAGKSEPSSWILQSVLISPERRYAIINGEVVALGGSIAGAELVAVAEERVTLRTREGVRVVHLFPDVERLGADELVPAARKSTLDQEPKGSGTNK